MKRITKEYFSAHDQLINIMDEQGVCRVGITLTPGGYFSVRYFDSAGKDRAWVYGAKQEGFDGVTEYEVSSGNAISIKWRCSEIPNEQLIPDDSGDSKFVNEKKEMPSLDIAYVSESVNIPDCDNIIRENTKFDATGMPIEKIIEVRSKSSLKRHVKSRQIIFSPQEISTLTQNRLLKD